MFTYDINRAPKNFPTSPIFVHFSHE